ncbi:protein heading date 3a-like [Diplodia corticola]|uniref:Protein heading date 3a-like n=1 Tax=Diplodia corticola TaxID=236234 RepID=A0A1J9RDV0_9PEZI|nr:protein heading date 3a-like [Diplodia corticola]OJD30731.1 protein heading date 3a-like [Diplodia corticola]
MLSNILSLGLLAVARTTLAQTPPYFTPSTDVNLPATFDANSTTPDFFVVGGVFSINATQSAPQLYLPSNSTFATTSNASNPATFILLMFDPDAPSPQDPSKAQILHWLQPGVRLSRSIEPTASPSSGAPLSMLSAADTSTPALVPYQGPQPPSVAPHRYIVTLWRQPNSTGFEVPEAWSGYVGGENRTGFDAAKFVEDAGLQGGLVAATYFLAGKETVGEGRETYEGDDAAAGIGGNTSVPVNASGSAGAATATTTTVSGGSSSATADAASATESSGAGRLGGVGAVVVAGVVGAVALLG